MLTSEVLSKAADKIERDGHCKHNIGSDSGPNCALGAIMFAAAGTTVAVPGVDRPDHYYAAARRFNAATGGTLRFNNAPERTKEEVIAMFRAVAATEKSREARLLPVVIPQVCHA